MKDFETFKGVESYDKIEVIGGVVRTPKIQEILKEFYSIEIGQHVNGDDSPALGASYIAANYTAGVRVKNLVYSDGPNYEVKYDIENNGEFLI